MAQQIKEFVMTEQSDSRPPLTNPTEITETIKSIAERSQMLVETFLAEQSAGQNASTGMGQAYPMSVGETFLKMTKICCLTRPS